MQARRGSQRSAVRRTPGNTGVGVSHDGARRDGHGSVGKAEVGASAAADSASSSRAEAGDGSERSAGDRRRRVRASQGVGRGSVARLVQASGPESRPVESRRIPASHVHAVERRLAPDSELPSSRFKRAVRKTWKYAFSPRRAQAESDRSQAKESRTGSSETRPRQTRVMFNRSYWASPARWDEYATPPRGEVPEELKSPVGRRFLRRR